MPNCADRSGTERSGRISALYWGSRFAEPSRILPTEAYRVFAVGVAILAQPLRMSYLLA